MIVTNAALCLSLIAGGPTGANAPAKVEHAPTGGTITLKPEAEKRLAITIGKIEERPVRDVLVRSGRIDSAPGGRGPIAAPVDGTILAPPGRKELLLPGAKVSEGQVVMRLLPLIAPDRNLEVDAKRDFEFARARLDMAEKRAARMKTLLKEGAVDEAAREQAQAELDVAKAELDAAKQRVARAANNPMSADVSLSLRAPHDGVLMSSQVASGQAVTRGAPLFEVVAEGLWVEVPVYVGALPKIDEAAKASVRVLGSEVRRDATRVARPPVAGMGSAVSLFYAIDDAEGLTPGLRATVELPLSDSARARRVAPWSSIVWDANGGAWVYARTAPLTYRRMRAEVSRIVGDVAVLDAGPPVGTEVATAGVMELFGTETGIGK